MERSIATEKAPRIARRELLRSALAVPLACVPSERRVAAQDEARTDRSSARPSGLITRQKNPDNLGFPFSTLDTKQFLTSNEQFYVRSHFPVPEVDAKTWKLSIEGAVEQPFEIGFDELRSLPSKTVTALLECSGNGRVFLDPPQVGVRWELDAVGTAKWKGVPLVAILERAKVKPGAVEVILEGADRGEFEPPSPQTPGAISYARSLPLEKARRPEVLLAYEMNGAKLPPRHGHPVRAVVPGWYGMASVKWLKRIIVTDRPYNGFFQTFIYSIWDRRHGVPSLVPVTEIDVKAQIARPAPYEVVPRSAHYRMFGAAWVGESRIAKVEVSDDGGENWSAAKLLGDAVPFAWRFWEYDWRTPDQAGRRIVMTRATDDRGRTQPMKRDPDRRDAMISHVLPIEVEVSSGPQVSRRPLRSRTMLLG